MIHFTTKLMFNIYLKNKIIKKIMDDVDSYL